VPTVKITTVGNSLGIVLPREVLQRLRVDKGSLLYLVETLNGVELLPYEPTFAAQVDALEVAARSDRDVLRGLSLRGRHQAAGAAGDGGAVRRLPGPAVEDVDG